MALRHGADMEVTWRKRGTDIALTLLGRHPVKWGMTCRLQAGRQVGRLHVRAGGQLTRPLWSFTLRLLPLAGPCRCPCRHGHWHAFATWQRVRPHLSLPPIPTILTEQQRPHHHDDAHPILTALWQSSTRFRYVSLQSWASQIWRLRFSVTWHRWKCGVTLQCWA